MKKFLDTTKINISEATMLLSLSADETRHGTKYRLCKVCKECYSTYSLSEMMRILTGTPSAVISFTADNSELCLQIMASGLPILDICPDYDFQ